MQAVQKENSKLQFNSNNDSDEISIKKMGISMNGAMTTVQLQQERWAAASVPGQ